MNINPELKPLLKPGETVKSFEITESGIVNDRCVQYEDIKSKEYANKRIQIREIHCFDGK